MKLNRDDLMDRAVHMVGHDDFGPPPFVEGLDSLIAAIEADRALPEDRRAAVEARLTGPLMQRLNLYAQRKAHPEIAAQSIIAPLVIIGLPRSGTTFLHSLLAQDPAARSPLAWQLSDLSSPPRAETLETDPRIAAVDTALAALPDDFKRMHMVGARLPDECNAITMMGFHSPNFDAGLDVPSYRDWYLRADAGPAYQTHLHTLQHLQAFTHGTHWVLKGPAHLFHMDSLLATYPDARIVIPHRDPAATIASLTSLISTIRGWTYTTVDRAAVGQSQLDFWATAIERLTAFRMNLTANDRMIDISYDDLVANPMGVVERIYQHFAIPLTQQARTAMEAFLARETKDRHGAHRYSLEDAGLTRGEVHARFQTYMAAYFPA